MMNINKIVSLSNKYFHSLHEFYDHSFDEDAFMYYSWLHDSLDGTFHPSVHRIHGFWVEGLIGWYVSQK